MFSKYVTRMRQNLTWDVVDQETGQPATVDGRPATGMYLLPADDLAHQLNAAPMAQTQGLQVKPRLQA